MRKPGLKKCPECDGSGVITDQLYLGTAMRQIREKSGLSLREVARRMGLSATHLSDLELGQRRWLPLTIEHFKEVVKGSVK